MHSVLTMYGKIYGRFFLKQDLGIEDDNTPDTVTISEILETYPLWDGWVSKLTEKNKQLFTMFETSDVHPIVIEKMKLFDKVIVPYRYLKNILVKHGINCEALDWYTSPLIRSKPDVKPKVIDKNRIIFLYNGTNDIRKNVTTLTKIFACALENTNHILIVKTNKPDGLTVSKNINIITDRISNETLTSLFNISDYCVTCTRGEGVGLLHLEAQYFNKPILSHDQGVLGELGVDIITLPSTTVRVNHSQVPTFLKNVFHDNWWEVSEVEAVKVIKSIMNT